MAFCHTISNLSAGLLVWWVMATTPSLRRMDLLSLPASQLDLGTTHGNILANPDADVPAATAAAAPAAGLQFRVSNELRQVSA